MTTWNGEERRKVNNDWIERDRLLSEVHSDMKHMVKWAQEHNEDDNKRFALVYKEIELGKKVLWGCAGVLVTIEFLIKLIK